MPRIMYVQADNASDNKNWAFILFLAMLVYHSYTVEVYLSFLLVGHTHEDIDQVFSILSRVFRYTACATYHSPMPVSNALNSSLLAAICAHLWQFTPATGGEDTTVIHIRASRCIAG